MQVEWYSRVTEGWFVQLAEHVRCIIKNDIPHVRHYNDVNDRQQKVTLARVNRLLMQSCETC